jgi:sulfur carrier protein
MAETISDTIWVNGQAHRCAAPTPLATFLDASGYALGTPGMAVALNDTVVPRSRWHATQVQPNDRIELVSATQGG